MRYQKRRRGSNQYADRPKARYWGSIALLAIVSLVAIIGVYGFMEVQSRLTIAFASESVVQSMGTNNSKLQAENNSMEKELEAIKKKYPDPTQEQIEAYIKLIFGKEGKLAVAVTHHECSPWHKEYPKCHHKSDVEDSIGLFQINLYNKYQKIHADRIPGNTIAEKELWLENPFNNTLYAFWVRQTSSWEQPWVTSYKAALVDLGKK